MGVGEPGQVFEDLLATPIVYEPAVQGKSVRGLGSVASAVVDRFPELTYDFLWGLDFLAGIGTGPAISRPKTPRNILSLQCGWRVPWCRHIDADGES